MSEIKQGRPSIAHLRINKPSPLTAGLRKLLLALGPDVNKNDQVDVLIEALLWHGVTASADVIQIAKELGFDQRHVSIRLAKGAGKNPDRHRWWRDPKEQYHLH